MGEAPELPRVDPGAAWLELRERAAERGQPHRQARQGVVPADTRGMQPAVPELPGEQGKEEEVRVLFRVAPEEALWVVPGARSAEPEATFRELGALSVALGEHQATLEPEE